VVNAGGVLLLREQELLTASTPAMAAAIAIGAVTMLGAAVAMAVRSDVKGMLACSTSAQMGFMLMTCGLGAWAATIIHIVGHAMYKAAGFLGAGGAIAAHARRRTVPAAPAARTAVAAQALAAAAAPAAGLALVAATVGVSTEKSVLLVFAWVTGAAALWSALRRAQRPAEMLAAAAITTALSATYLLAAIGLGGALGLPSADGHPPAWIALVPLAAAGLALLAWQQGGALRDRLYVRAMRLSRPQPLPHWHLGSTAAPGRPQYTRRPTTVTEGGAA
jgi:NADH:ubiquinone oxidoreductase subunit 5 (subunit L)/multisubunit Na+/H+ antiporter MnhA subunit